MNKSIKCTKIIKSRQIIFIFFQKNANDRNNRKTNLNLNLNLSSNLLSRSTSSFDQGEIKKCEKNDHHENKKKF